MTDKTSKDSLPTKMVWVDPVIRDLEVSETTVAPNRGIDGEARWADCTLS